jgi:hypothetical protein
MEEMSTMIYITTDDEHSSTRRIKVTVIRKMKYDKVILISTSASKMTIESSEEIG